MKNKLDILHEELKNRVVELLKSQGYKVKTEFWLPSTQQELLYAMLWQFGNDRSFAAFLHGRLNERVDVVGCKSVNPREILKDSVAIEISLSTLQKDIEKLAKFSFTKKICITPFDFDCKIVFESSDNADIFLISKDRVEKLIEILQSQS